MRLVSVLLVVALLAGCSGDQANGGPAALERLLEAMPAGAVERAVFFSTGDGGFGSVLGVEDLAAAFGFRAEAVTAVLESGEPPVTVLGGDFDIETVARTFEGYGYLREDIDGWAVVRAADLTVDAPVLTGAVPAAAVRRDALVLGSQQEVAAALEGQVAADIEWVDRLTATLAPATAAAVIGAPPDVARRAEQAGTTAGALLEQADVGGPLPVYQGFAIGVAAEASPRPVGTPETSPRPVGTPETSPRPVGTPGGVIALAYVPGEGGTAAAAALALRLTTSTVLGDPSRRTTDVLEPGAPRYRDETSVVVLPVEWTDFDAARLRADIMQARLPWLVPS